MKQMATVTLTDQNKFIPIGVFWDIENCCVPKWKSALLIVQAVRKQFYTNHREFEFMCVCDTRRENHIVIQELNQAQVNVVHVGAVSKNAADDKLRQNIRRFADLFTPPVRIVLISSDVNFAADLYDLQYRKKFEVILIHSHQAHESLLHSANEHYLYEDIVSTVPVRTPSKPLGGQTELIVTGYCKTLHPKSIRCKLQKLSSNTGGKVICVTKYYTLLRFPSRTNADRARGRMDGHEFYGSQIHVDYSVPGHYNGEDSYNRNYYPDRVDSWRHQTRPYSQSFRSNPQTQSSTKNDNSAGNSAPSSGEVSPLDALLSGQLEQYPDETCPGDDAVHNMVKKFNNEKKSSRQLLMLQQQIYQEEQAPICNESTQFYSHVTQVHETKYYGYGNPWQQSNYHGNRNQIESGYSHQGDSSYNHPGDQYNQHGDSYNPHNYNGYDNSYYNYQNSQNSSGNYGNTNNPAYKSFQPMRSTSPSETSTTSSSPCPFNNEEYPGSVDLLISNLDYNISPREWKNILSTTFHPHVKILYIDVSLQPDNTSLGLIKVSSIEEARFAICQFHRKKIGYKRIHVTLKNEDVTKTVSTVRSEAIALLSEAKDNVLPLFKFIELFNKRFNRSVSVSELYRMKDTIEIREQGGSGRMIHLAQELQQQETVQGEEDGEVQEIIEQAVCTYHCPEGSISYTEAVNTSILPNVKLHLKTFAPQVHSLLLTHDGDLPLMSFPACFSVEVMPLQFVYDGGVPLEHLISCVPGVQILVSNTGVKKVHWAENKPPNSPDMSRGGQQLAQFSKEMLDLLKSAPYCRMSFSKFIPSYHQHFGRQCRVADYGYTRLQEVFEAIPHVLQVLGSGDRKVLTLTHRAQVKRFIADLLKLLKNIPGRIIYLSALAEEFCKLFNKKWDITEYGVCHLDDMLCEIPPETVEIVANEHDTIIALPRKDRSPEELERLKQFSLEVVDLLKHSHQCCMLFNKFVPAYHHHFGHQCRVSDYGFVKLQDLFEALPQIVQLQDEGEEKVIYLTKPELRKVIGEHIVSLLKKNKVQCFLLDKLMGAFMQHYGYSLPLHELNVDNVEQLMTKLKHVLKVEQYDGKQYIVLSDRTSAPPLARQVLQLLMDQSGGSLPLMELCSRYKTTFGIDPDIQKIKEELLDYVQISGDDESGVISLTPLQILARDVRVLLQTHGKMSLSKFEKLFYQKYNVEIKPALYGFPTIVALLMAIPHVISIKGKGNRRMVHLSGDLQGSLPIIDESYTRHDSDTPSNDSGSVLTDDDLPFEHKKFLPSDLLDGSVPSVIPSPDLRPTGDHFIEPIDLIKFESPHLSSSPFPDAMEGIYSSLTEEERSQQKTPLCQTPTSQLLQLAAQFLPTPPPTPNDEMNPKPPSLGMEPSEHQTSGNFKLFKESWWQASPSQLQEVSESIKNAGLVEKMANADLEATTASMVDALVDAHLVEPDHFDFSHHDAIVQDGNNNEKSKHHGTEADYSLAIHSLSAAIAILREQNKQEHPTNADHHEPESFSFGTSDKVSETAHEDVPASCPTPLQPGSYWYSKKFQSPNEHQKELPSHSTEEVRKVLASLAVSKPTPGHFDADSSSKSKLEEFCKVRAEDNITPQASIDNSESFSLDTVVPDTTAETSHEINENNKITILKKEVKQQIGPKFEDDFDIELRETEEIVRNNVALQRDSRKQRKLIEHNIDNCVAADCMCYEAVFREDHPIDTSSMKSDSSFTESLDSPVKVIKKVQQKLSTSSLSDDSVNNSINKKRSRIAARFGGTPS